MAPHHSNSVNVNVDAYKTKAVLFDLDGTLVDTAKDFVRIIHEIAQENNWQPPNEDTIREKVSAGSQAMVSLFQLGNDEQLTNKSISTEHVLQLKEQFLQRYEADICVDSCLFRGIDELLTTLENHKIPWGIVTNKPRYLSEKLLEKLDLTQRCDVLVCPDDVTNSKPDPEPMYLAMNTIGLGHEVSREVIYIGDHIRDIQAGNNASMTTVLASYGYISPEERKSLNQWNADYTVDTPEKLVELISALII